MAKKKEPTTPAVSSFYLPEILREMGTQAKAPTSTDSIYGGASIGSRSGAFNEGVGVTSKIDNDKNKKDSDNVIPPLLSLDKSEGPKVPAIPPPTPDAPHMGPITPENKRVADIRRELDEEERERIRKQQEQAKNGKKWGDDFKPAVNFVANLPNVGVNVANTVVGALSQPFLRPLANKVLPDVEDIINNPIIKNFAGNPQDKDFKFGKVVGPGGFEIYDPGKTYTSGEKALDIGLAAANVVPVVGPIKAAVKGAATEVKVASGSKKIVKGAEKALKEAADKGPDVAPPSGGAPVAPTAPKTPPSRPITKTDIAAGKYGSVAGEMSSGSGISTRAGTVTPPSVAGGQQFAQAANRSSSALGEATRTMGVNESTVVTKVPGAVSAPKTSITKPPSPPSIKPSGAADPFLEAGASAASAAAKGASRASTSTLAGTTSSVISGIANQSSSSTPPTTPPSNMGPQFITRSGLEIWGRPGSGAPSDTPPPKPNKPELQTSAEISATPQGGTKTPPKDQTDTPVQRQEGTNYDPVEGTKFDPDAGVSKPNPDPFKPPSGDGGTQPPPGKFDEPAPPKDEPSTRKKIPEIGGFNVKSPADFARIPYIP